MPEAGAGAGAGADMAGPAGAAPPGAGADMAGTLIGISRRLRQAGMGASPDRVHAWLRALDRLDPASPVDLYRSGRLTMCARLEDLEIFDRVFSGYLRAAEQEAPAGPPEARQQVRAALFDDEGDEGDEAHDDELDIPAASTVERLAHQDLGELTVLEPELVRLLALAFSRSGEARRSARLRPSARGRADRARTLRRIMAGGGEMAELAFRAPRPRQRRVVLLVDVSGSMATYGEALLYFAHAASRRRHPRTEVFTIGTRLTRVTPLLVGGDPARTVREVMGAVVDRGGGTRLGPLVKEFLDRWGQRGVARGAVVVVLSDGWERGDPAELGRQMARLARLAHRVVWANPRKAQPGYQPLAAGMAAALPHVDDFVEGHSLAALVHLADVVLDAAHAGARRPSGVRARGASGARGARTGGADHARTG